MGRLQDRLDERAAGVGVAEPPTTPVRKVFAASTVGGRLQRRLNERAAGPKPTPAQPVPAPAQPVPTTIPKPVVQPIPEQPSRPEPSPKQEIVGELMGFPVYAEREELTKQKEAAEAEAIAGQTEVARKYIDAGVDYMLSPRQLSTVAGGVLERERLSPTAQAMGKVYDESYWAVRESYSQQAINEGASASEANQWADTQMASADSQKAIEETAEANMPELVNLMRQGAAPDLEGFGGSLKQLGIMAKYWGQFATLPLNRTLGALSNGLARVTGGEEIPLPTKEGLWMRREIDKGTLDTQMAAKILNAAGGDQKVAKEIVAVALSRAEGFDDAEMEYLLEAGVDNVLNTAGWIFELWAGGEIAGTVTGANKLATAARTSPELVPKALKAAHRARALFASMIGLDTYSQLRTDGANRKDAAMSAALITAVYYGLGEGLARGPGALAQFKGWRAERADYRILGLRKGATPKEVKVAVKALRIRLEPVINRVDVSPKVRQAAEQELFRAIKAADSITKRIWARVSAQAGVTPAPAARRMLPGAREAQAPPTEAVPVAARPAAPVRPPTGITPTAAVVKPPAPAKPPTGAVGPPTEAKPAAEPPTPEVPIPAPAPPEAAPAKPEVPPTPPEDLGRLRQRIMAVVKTKGLSEVQRKEITKNVVGVRRLTAARLTADELRSVLAAMEKARPRRVGMKKVITPKTERKIETLKERLISQGELTEERFTEQMAELRIKAPAYVDARTFPTETQGKELIRKINEEALVIRPREQARQALATDENAGLKTHADGIEGIIAGRTTKRATLGKVARAFQGKGARYVVSDLQEQTGKPFYNAWSGMNDVHLSIRARVTGYMDRIRRSSPEARRIMKNADAAQRVNDYISSKLVRGAAPYPEGINAEEVKVAQEVESILGEFEPLVRIARFMDYYYQKAEIPNAPASSLTRATDIYESQGVDALREYLDTQTWGIITKGYEPREAITRKISFAPRGILFGKGHIKVRSGDALAQERTIFQRMDSYMRSMLNKVELEPHARAVVRVYDDNMDLLASPRQVAKSITLMIEEAKGFRDSGTILDQGIRRLVSQAFRAVFIRPWMSFRNLWQNAAFNEDLLHGDLVNPANKVLTDTDWEYFRERVDQTGPLRQQYLMQEERALPGLKTVSKIADRCAHYAYADKANRGWAFWGRINRIRRAVKGVDLADSQSVKRAMDQGGFAGMELLQQRRALEIWAEEGVDAMARYAAAEHVMNVHFAYERAQRSIVEMGTTGRIWGSLLAFPRSWGERIYREGRKVTKGGPYTARYKAVGRLIQMTIIPALVGELLRRIAGKKRNPYNPLNIVLWTPGGLIIGAIEALGNTMYLTTRALCGDDAALGQLPATYSRLAKLYVPFYEVAMDVIEASLHGKNLDRKAARKIREAMSESYKVRDSSYEAKRTWVEAFQKAIVGGKAAEEKEKEAKKVPSRKNW